MNPTFISLPCQISTQQIPDTKVQRLFFFFLLLWFVKDQQFLKSRSWRSAISWFSGIFIFSPSLLIYYNGLNIGYISAVACLYWRTNMILSRLSSLCKTKNIDVILSSRVWIKYCPAQEKPRMPWRSLSDNFCTCFTIFYFCLSVFCNVLQHLNMTFWMGLTPVLQCQQNHWVVKI